ncbi:MAG: GMP synthase [Candidatus Altiarchaeales archaeon WOR_SM1_79]|nr:MAG: GMP synthase [Candidatus Altiarchaeales archaeon WOR_SM1_79]
MILIINNRGQYVHRIWRSMRYLGAEADMVPGPTPVHEILGKEPDGIILSGGPYSVHMGASEIGNCYEILSRVEVPILGICLGHQIIAKFFGGEVERGERAEYAQVSIRIEKEDDLFRGMGNELLVWESHKDEVTRMPEDFERLAYSEICEFEAIKHKEKPIYGVQFHPEVYHTQHGSDILRNFLEVCEGEI